MAGKVSILTGQARQCSLRACQVARRIARAQKQSNERQLWRKHMTERMRHDLVGPLTTLSGFLELLAEEGAGPLTAEQQAWIGNMRSALQRIFLTIDATLDRNPSQ